MDPTQQPITPLTTGSGGQSKKSKHLGVVVTTLVLLLVVALVACIWWYVQNQADIASQQEDGPTVSITADSYSPASIRIKAGQEVTWTNTDQSDHELKADTEALPAFDSVEPLKQGDSYTYAFDKSGTYRYYDPANPGKLNGEVIVE